MINQILEELQPYNARLVAVSKTQPVGEIRKIYQAGQRIFGENRVQELMTKVDLLPADIEWHLIGHLQRNKVKYIAPFISMIHSVDSIELAGEIEKQAARHNRSIPILLQIRIAEEESKFGIKPEQVDPFILELLGKGWENLEIAGVMGMASFVDDELQIRNEFRLLKDTFDHLKSTHFVDSKAFKEISMGMSGDYRIALEQGSTMVRIGTLIFGVRH